MFPRIALTRTSSRCSRARTSAGALLLTAQEAQRSSGSRSASAAPRWSRKTEPRWLPPPLLRTPWCWERGEPLPPGRRRVVLEGVRADADHARPLAGPQPRLPGLEEEVDAAVRPAHPA